MKTEIPVFIYPAYKKPNITDKLLGKIKKPNSLPEIIEKPINPVAKKPVTSSFNPKLKTLPTDVFEKPPKKDVLNPSVMLSESGGGSN